MSAGRVSHRARGTVKPHNLPGTLYSLQKGTEGLLCEAAAGRSPRSTMACEPLHHLGMKNLFKDLQRTP